MSLKIIKAGLLDTIQDLGRYGFQDQGINPGGAMDRFSASLANALLGKKMHSPVIELHFPASEILFQHAAVVCLAGADFQPLINGETVAVHQPLFVPSNSLLTFDAPKHGARVYLGMLNDLQITPWLTSYSTSLKAGAGGYNGRKLQRGDVIVASSFSVQKKELPLTLLPWHYRQEELQEDEVACIRGNEWDWLSADSQHIFFRHEFAITTSAERMGYRLQGTELKIMVSEQLVSSPVSFGTIQLLPNGQLIVLMADHQTTGGYPRIAHVIGAHLPRLAQMKPGHRFKFVETSLDKAEEKWFAQQQFLQQLQATCHQKMQNWLHAH